MMGSIQPITQGKKHILRTVILGRILQFFSQEKSNCPGGRWESMDAWSDHREEQERPSRVILLSAGDKDW